MVGPVNEELKAIATALGLSKHIQWIGEIAYAEVASQMQTSDALLLFSRYENQPCVILEALCCGLPVLSTNVGGIAEVLNDSNGVLVETEDTNAMAAAIVKMIIEYNRYDRRKISENAIALYNYNSIGTQLIEVYDSLFSQSQ
jgi:glycosyltransferase involved in cell wall biosynthesis